MQVWAEGFCSDESASSLSMQKNEEREVSGMKLDLPVVSAVTRSAVTASAAEDMGSSGPRDRRVEG